MVAPRAHPCGRQARVRGLDICLFRPWLWFWLPRAEEWLRNLGFWWRDHLVNHGVRVWQVALAVRDGQTVRYMQWGRCQTGYYLEALNLFCRLFHNQLITSFYPDDGRDYVRRLTRC